MPSSRGVRAGSAFIDLNAVDNVSDTLKKLKFKIKNFSAGFIAAGAGLTALRPCCKSRWRLPGNR